MQGMEPMNVGSPTSPSSPGTHPPQSPFLPAYLMGDSFSNMSPSRAWQAGGSPPRSSLNRSINVGASNTSFLGSSSRNDSRIREINSMRPKEKLGAPPSIGLIESLSSGSHSGTPYRRDDFDTSNLGASFQGTPGQFGPHTPGQFGSHTPGQFGPQTPGQYGPPTPGAFGTLNFAKNSIEMYNTGKKASLSPTQIDPFYTQGENICADDDLDDTWITIFGFPPAATSFILQEFSQYGNILQHTVAPDGNWLHIHYQSKLQARKALSKNGKVFGGSIMVGVTPCIDKSVMTKRNDDKENSVNRINASGYSSPMTPSMGGLSRPTSIRPLNAAYHASTIDHQVLQSGHAPQRKTNAVSKIMEYMFGW